MFGKYSTSFSNIQVFLFFASFLFTCDFRKSAAVCHLLPAPLELQPPPWRVLRRRSPKGSRWSQAAQPPASKASWETRTLWEKVTFLAAKMGKNQNQWDHNRKFGFYLPKTGRKDEKTSCPWWSSIWDESGMCERTSRSPNAAHKKDQQIHGTHIPTSQMDRKKLTPQEFPNGKASPTAPQFVCYPI